MSDDMLRHVPALRAYAQSLCGRQQDPNDLVRAIQNADKNQLGTQMRACQSIIMRNRIHTTIRKSTRKRTGSAGCASDKPASQPTQEWRPRHQKVWDQMAGMPGPYTESIVMASVLAKSQICAAETLACDIVTIPSRVNRARTKLKHALVPEV